MHVNRIAILCAAFPLACAGCNAAGNPAVSSATQPKTADNISWVTYTDSAEGAFSMEVPVGWQVDGGMYRFGYFDVRWMMDIRSLDGKLIIRIGDPNVPPYVLPGPHSGPAGRPAIKPQMYQMMVDNYREAKPYAETYAKHRFANVCSFLTPRDTEWTPAMPPAWQNEAGARATEASIAYDCATSDGPRIVNVYARNTLHGNDGLWQVDPIISIIATPDGVHLAQAMTQRMINSWQVTPQWKQYQQQMTKMGLAQIRTQFTQFLQQMQVYHQQRQAAMNQQVAHYESQQHAQAQQASGWGEILTGLTDVVDPNTGTKFQVFSGPKANYYTNGLGVTVNSNLNPGSGFHQVTVTGP
jgi:hypothetical protein